MVEKTVLVEKKKEDIKEVKEIPVEKEIKPKQEVKQEKEELKKKLTIEELPGVGAATAEKLREAGFDTMLSIAVASPGELTEIAGLTEATARKIINTARNKMDMGFESGDQLLEKRKSINKITTNSRALDALFGGGIESGAITECYGEFGVGKSALAHQLAVNIQLPKEKGGAEGMAVWLDTESSLPYDEKILIEKNNFLGLVKIGELVETALNNTERITRYGQTISTADNFENIKAVSYDPEDYKIKTFKISGFIKHPKQKIYEVKLKSGRKVRVTKYHNFFTLNKNCELSEISTEKLKIGNKIAVAGSIPIKMGINSLDTSKLFGDRRDLLVRGGESFKKIITTHKKEICELIKNRESCDSSFNNWLSRNELPLDIYNKINEHIDDNTKSNLFIGGWIRKSMIPLLVPLTKDFMKFLGLYVAEGSCLKNKTVIITNTQDYIEFYLREFINSFGLSVKRSKSDLKINSKPFALLIEKLDLGYTANTKRLPNFIFNLSKEYISSFLEGYIDGDGTIDDITGSTTCETKSAELVEGLLYSTCALNIPANQHTNTRSYKCSPKNHIRPERDGEEYQMQAISWQTALVRDSRLDELPNEELQFSSILLENIRKQFDTLKNFSKIIDMDFSYLTNILKNGSKSIRKSTLKKIIGNLKESRDIQKIKKIIDSDIWFDAIKSIKELDAEQVYDVEVMPDNKEIQNFIGGHGGIILHNTFRPERIKQIAELNNLDPEKTLKNIKIARCFNSDHQMLLAEKVEDLITKDNLPIKLVIVDSLMGHFRSDFSGRGQLADRQQKLNKHLHILQKLASNYNVVVYITNQVMSKPDTFFGDPTAAVGGHIVGHNCVAAGSLIQLANGTIQAIGDLFEPATNQVISLDMKNGFVFCSKELKTLFVNVKLEEAYEIDAGSRITSSNTHRFFKLNKEGKIEETYAKDLKVGDYVALTKEIKIKGKIQKLPEFEIDEVFEVPEKESQKLKSWLKENEITRKEFCTNLGVRPRQLRRILNQSYPTSKQVIENMNFQGDGQVLINATQVETNKHHIITIPKEFTPELSQVLGYFIGDGNVDNYSVSFRDQRKEILEQYQKAMYNLFGEEGSIIKLKDKNCFDLSINNKTITKVFEYLLFETVRLVSQSPDEYVKAFIKGFADAEGSVDKDRPRITISQKNERLLHIMQMLLLRFNIRSVFEESVNSDGNLIYNLRLDNRDCYEFGKQIGMTARDKQKQINYWLEYGKKQKFTKETIPVERTYLINLLKRAGLKPFSVITYRSSEYKTVTKKNFEKIVAALDKKQLNPEVQKEVNWLKQLLVMPVRWEKIRKITQKQNKELFYDLTIPESENYIANSFVVHNSTYRVYLRKGKKGTRVAKMIDAPHLPESEAIFQVTEKGLVDVT